MKSSSCMLCSTSPADFLCRKEAVDVLRCPVCGLVFTAEMQEPAEMEGHYSMEYFDPYVKTRSVHDRKRFRARLKEIRKLHFPGTLLDVGCGAGFFLNIAREGGHHVSGVELSGWAAAAARENFGLRVFNGQLKEAGFSPESFDVITLWHILEHVADPRDLLSHVHGILKEDGILAVEVPNIGSIAARIAGKHWELLAPREHFYYFNPQTLLRLLRLVGFIPLRQQSYFWTTPEMVLHSRVGGSPLLTKPLLRRFPLLLHPFSLLRFAVLPCLLIGDILTVYAAKAPNGFHP
ncbi:MAG: class I SAM-dependent methyltransferase [Thermodesulfobacteriota bacterium]